MMGGLMAIANQGRALIGPSSGSRASMVRIKHFPLCTVVSTTDYHFPIDALQLS